MSSVELGSSGTYLRLTHDDGTSYSLVAELRVDTLLATHRVNQHYSSGFSDLADFVESLAADWSGWVGSRHCESLEHDLAIDAVHDVHVSLDVRLTGGTESDWQARGTVVLEPGEELGRAARDIRELASGFAPDS